MFVQFSIRPARPTHLEREPARGTETLERSGCDGCPRPMSARLEGSWDQVMSVIRGCHQALVDGHPRVVTTIVVIDDQVNGVSSDWPHCLEETIPSVKAHGGLIAPNARRIPVSL